MPVRKLSVELVPFTSRPACFESVRQWVEWQALEHASRPNGRHLRFGPCHDCTRGYQAQMIHEKRCARPWLDLTYVAARKDTE